ncbi:MAG: SRPBCC family protein [Planctomycetes bacterium]|nr:SRPBCC family protein [Planctomycetota bacterium]
MLEARHISVPINRPAEEIYEFASNPMNLPKWATGLGDSIKNESGDWIADSSMGRIKIKFAGKNKLGVLDHVVTLPSGKETYNPMRVFSNNGGSELTFTLYRQPDMTDEMFDDDAKTVKSDMERLKALLENSRFPVRTAGYPDDIRPAE